MNLTELNKILYKNVKFSEIYQKIENVLIC